MAEPLRYSISKLSQLSECKSNSSKFLKIRVAQITDDEELSGCRVTVEHPRYGTLFGYIVQASGELIYPETYNEITIADMLEQLENFGFLIEYNQRVHLPGAQVDYLKTVQSLGFDKIRALPVHYLDNSVKVNLVVFQVEENPKWLSWPYECGYKEYITALDNGSAINISGISQSKHFRWDWLTYVGDIGDIIDDNVPENGDEDAG